LIACVETLRKTAVSTLTFVVRLGIQQSCSSAALKRICMDERYWQEDGYWHLSDCDGLAAECEGPTDSCYAVAAPKACAYLSS
jgi:hypothetical protein